MSALRIFATANPSSIGTPILPMTQDDAQFWRLFNARHRSPAASAPPAPGAAQHATVEEAGGLLDLSL